jgi:hypothetical protein
MANGNLSKAKQAKNDEFYTQFLDIQKEVAAYLEYNPNVFRNKTILLPCDDPEWSNFTKFFAQNFERFGLKKLISTSYAADSKQYKTEYQPTPLEKNDPKFDKIKTTKHGKIFTLTRDKNKNGKIDVADLEWDYLQGDGDFRSDEIKKLRNEADIIITNPPFSLFREFWNWLVESKKQFLIIGNINAITYTEVFPLLKKNKAWLGNNYKVNGGAMFYEIPEDLANIEQVREIRTNEAGKKVFITRVQGVRWFTNLDHGRRHQPLPLMTEKEIIKFVTRKPFDKYDNYDAIEVALVKNIPSDYKGKMGVPVSVLDKFSPEQFTIIGSFNAGTHGEELGATKTEINLKGKKLMWNGPVVKKQPLYKRIVIKHKK